MTRRSTWMAALIEESVSWFRIIDEFHLCGNILGEATNPPLLPPATYKGQHILGSIEGTTVIWKQVCSGLFQFIFPKIHHCIHDCSTYDTPTALIGYGSHDREMDGGTGTATYNSGNIVWAKIIEAFGETWSHMFWMDRKDERRDICESKNKGKWII